MTQRQSDATGRAIAPHLEASASLRIEADRLMEVLQDLIDRPPTGCTLGRVDGIASQMATLRRNVLRLRASQRHGH